MAQHVQDSTVIERRLRPIYDSLEVGNNKKALQDVDKLLKKHPSLTCARALKALALLRLGREEESNNLLAAVNSEKPTDDQTLQVLTFCYKEMEQLEKICDLYSYAAKQSPGNEETLAHLFISYVRLDDYKSQQSVALQLYKTKPKNPYYFWAVMSVVLQGIRGPDSDYPDKRKLYLALADRMVNKLILEGKLETEQEIQLYLSILEEQQKYTEALEFLSGPVCEQLYPGAPVYIKINLLKKLEMWEEMNNLLRTLLKDDRDRWDYYQDFLTATFKLHEVNSNNEDGISIMDACHDFLCQLIENGKKVRGPYLARLELHKRLRENGMNADELLGSFSNLLIEYFRLFGNKSCCTHDITLFLTSMELEDRLKLEAELLKTSEINNSFLPQNKDQLQKHICCLQIGRICGSHINVETEHFLAFNTSLKLHYEHGLISFGKDLLPTDIGPFDAYALLGANVMYDISVKQNTSKYLLEALCLLLYVLKNSPSNFHVKLLCLKIYHIFGCFFGANQMYDSLDIKHIQLDSMGYLHCNLLPLNGGFNIATKQIYDTTLKFFTTSYKERLEYIATSYKFGSFSKLLEFMDFRDRLSNSIHYAVISAEEIILELVNLNGTFQQNLNTYKSMNIRPGEERIRWDDLTDNRDLSVMVRWDPIHLVDAKDEKIDSFNQEIEALQIRSILLRLISSFVELLHYPAKTESKDDINSVDQKETEIIELLRDKWSGLYRRLRLMNYNKPEKKFLVDLLPSRLHTLLEMPYEKMFYDLSNFIIDLFTGSFTSDHIQILNNNVAAIFAIIQSQIHKHNISEDELWIRRDIQSQVYSGIEMLSLYAFVLSSCHEKYIQGLHNTHSKKTKKKETKAGNIDQSSLTDKDRIQIISDLMRYLKTNLHNCTNAISSWKAPQLKHNLIEFMTDMSLDPKIEVALSNEVKSTFNENHDLIVYELKNLIKDKLRMVNK